jgi:hypothetical protein
MPIQTINIGNYVNDGLGDDLRTAFQKVNANFADINSRSLIIGGVNVGTSGVGIFKGTNVDLFEFKKLVAGDNISVTDQINTIVIDSPLQPAFTVVVTDAGNLTATESASPFGIKGGDNVTVTLDGQNVRISAFGEPTRLSADPNPTLSGNLNLNGYSIQGPGSMNGNLTLLGADGTGIGNVFGNLTGLVYGIDIRDIAENPRSFDFGHINAVIETVFQLILFTTDLELGTINGGSPFILDFGTI